MQTESDIKFMIATIIVIQVVGIVLAIFFPIETWMSKLCILILGFGGTIANLFLVAQLEEEEENV